MKRPEGFDRRRAPAADPETPRDGVSARPRRSGPKSDRPQPTRPEQHAPVPPSRAEPAAPAPTAGPTTVSGMTRPAMLSGTPRPTPIAASGAPASEASERPEPAGDVSRSRRLLKGFSEAVWASDHEPDPVAPKPTRDPREPRDRAAERALRVAARRRRRYEKAEVRRFTRRTRRRKITWTVIAGTVVTMGGLLAIAVYSPLLALTDIRIDGTSRIAQADLHAAVDGQLGTPLALLDMGRMQQELGDFPLIRSYTTETLPPNTLVIHIVERAPIGSLEAGAGYALVDPAGIVIERSTDRIPGVPLIETDGKGADSAAFRSAVEVLSAMPDSVLSRLDTITATTKDDVRLTLTDTGASILWGSADQSDYKARVLAALLANLPNASQFNVTAPGRGSATP